ncbi:MAG: hypothetical protein R3Y21_03885 [Mycoplasmatota bacterium]
MKTMNLSEIDKQYYGQLNKEKKYSDTLLLTEFLINTYYYSANLNNNITIYDLLKKIETNEKYTKHTKDMIVQNAIKILKIKYNIEIRSIEPLLFISSSCRGANNERYK